MILTLGRLTANSVIVRRTVCPCQHAPVSALHASSTLTNLLTPDSTYDGEDNIHMEPILSFSPYSHSLKPLDEYPSTK